MSIYYDKWHCHLTGIFSRNSRTGIQETSSASLNEKTIDERHTWPPEQEVPSGWHTFSSLISSGGTRMDNCSSSPSSPVLHRDNQSLSLPFPDSVSSTFPIPAECVLQFFFIGNYSGLTNQTSLN